MRSCAANAASAVTTTINAAREDAAVLFLLLPFLDVPAPALHEMTRELQTQRMIGTDPECLQSPELRAQQRQQVVKRGFVAGVRCRGEQEQMARVEHAIAHYLGLASSWTTER